MRVSFSFKLDWGSYNVCIAKSAFKYIVAFWFLKFLSSEFASNSIANLHVWLGYISDESFSGDTTFINLKNVSRL